ncbi:porin [Marinimicrobium sp. C6131]|uniref:porin n=1 Tax=Marinimicrobium sp. C6131 TaxID=3022676 RepID=UPI00223E7FD4|nr:porin [Marinimicrobium sp. C6131]UZJ44852.1 porin [Marinimicrobium sp. C6131]
MNFRMLPETNNITVSTRLSMKQLPAIRLSHVLLIVSFIALPVRGDATAPSWNINGFGTLGVAHSDEDQADFTTGLLADEGAGYSDEWSLKVDSKVGVQLTANFASKFKAVLQVVSEQGHDGSFDPQVEWANVSYDVTPELTVRIGRTVQPSFMTSEYRKVGYANPSVRPPAEVYNLVPVTNSDGIDVSYQSRFNEVTNTLHLLFGKKTTDLPDGFELESDDSFTLANTLEWRDTTLFAGYSQTDLTVDVLTPFFDGFRAFGPEGEYIADRFDLDDTTVRIVSVGGRYDPGTWFILGEWANNRSRSFVGEHRGWYLTGGVRVASLTPYLTFADQRAKGDLSHPGLPFPQAQPLNETLNLLLSQNTSDQSRIAVGARWDFAPSVALKVQYDRIDLRRGTRGVLSNTQPGFEGDEPVSVFSTTVDFVF